jgi:zinc/manganese transport system substrate-binding protein
MAPTRYIVTFLAMIFAGSALAQGAPAERLKVVATFSILGDLVRNVGGDRIALTTLVGPEGDAHVYAPSPGDGRKLAQAAIVFVNGLGFEGWIARLVKSSGTKAQVVEAARRVTVLEREGEAHGHGHSHDSAVDPHAWQSVANARLYVEAIRDALGAADPAGASEYARNAGAYLARLDELDREIRSAVAGLPEGRRRIITSHDAFAYFEAAYGIDFVAPQGVSTEAEASAKDVARIVLQIRREKIPAVFLENVTDPRLVERIAKESGARIGGRLHSDALSRPDGPAATYIDLMQHNIRTLSAALSS